MPRYPLDERAQAAAIDLIRLDVLGLGEEHARETKPVSLTLATYCLEYGHGLSDKVRQSLPYTLKQFDKVRQDIKSSGKDGDLEKRPPKLAYKMTTSTWRPSFLRWATEKFPEVADLVAATKQDTCADSMVPSPSSKHLGESPQSIAIEDLIPHPDNPRLAFNRDLMESLAAHMRRAGHFEERHAISVRKYKGTWQILSGHTRVEAARLAGLTRVMVWIVDVSDEEALLLLALDNQQEPLSKLEIALYSFKVIDQRKVRTQETFAAEFHLQASNLRRYRKGATVYEYVTREGGGTDKFIGCQGRVEHLAMIMKAPRGQWGALVMACLAQDWTIAQTERAAEGAARGESWQHLEQLSGDNRLVHPQQVESDHSQRTEDAESKGMVVTTSTEEATVHDKAEGMQGEASDPTAELVVSASSESVPSDTPTSMASDAEEEAQDDGRSEAKGPQPRPAEVKLRSAAISFRKAMEQLSSTDELKAHRDLLLELLAQIQQALAVTTRTSP